MNVKFNAKQTGFYKLYNNFRTMNCQQIKFKFEQPLLYQNDELKLTKCTLKGVLSIPADVAQSFGFPTELKVSAKSVVICRDGDVYSSDKGIKIAVAKAESNIYRNAAERFVRRWKRGNDIEIAGTDDDNPTLNSKVNAFVTKANSCVSHNQKYIKEIGG